MKNKDGALRNRKKGTYILLSIWILIKKILQYDNDVIGLSYFFPDQSHQNVQYKVDLDY